MNAADVISLADWRRQVNEMYARVRSSEDLEQAWSDWRLRRDALFAQHDQSPLRISQRGSFEALDYSAYDPSARVLGSVTDALPAMLELPASNGATFRFERVAHARFEIYGEACTLELFWLDAYGGGLFLPFADATAGTQTYGAGRYLIDTVKGADLGLDDGRLVLDFNFAYHPSCVYDPAWMCPLTPSANRLDIPIHAGERLPA